MLKDVQTQPLTISGMEPLGNYAYSIQFSDGHDTGIFAFDLLRQLGEAAELTATQGFSRFRRLLDLWPGKCR